MRSPGSTFRRSAALAVCLTSLLFGCEEDSLTPGATAIDCPSGAEQFWYVGVPAGGSTNIDFSVDTVAFSTAFDPAARVYTLNTDGSIGPTVLSTDDQFECTFPPPSFRCPSGSLNVTEDIVIGVRSLSSCAGSFGEYQLFVTGAEFVEPY